MPKLISLITLILVFSSLPSITNSQVSLSIQEATIFKKQLNVSHLQGLKKDFSNEPSTALYLDIYEKIAQFKINHSITFDSLLMYLTDVQFQIEKEDYLLFIEAEKELLLSEFYLGRQTDRLRKFLRNKNLENHPALKTLLIFELASNYYISGDNYSASLWFSKGLFENFQSKGDRIADNLEDALFTFYGLKSEKEKQFIYSQLKASKSYSTNASTEWQILFSKMNTSSTTNFDFNYFRSNNSIDSKRFRHFPSLIKFNLQSVSQENLEALLYFLRENTQTINEQRHLQTVLILLNEIMKQTYDLSSSQFRIQIADQKDKFNIQNLLFHQEYMTLVANLKLRENKLKSREKQELASINEKYQLSIFLLVCSLFGLTLLAFIYNLFSKKDEKLKQSNKKLEEIETKKNQLLEVIKELQDNILDLNLKLGIKYKMEQSLADNFRNLENLSRNELNQIINNLHIQLSNLNQIDRKTMEAESLVLQGKKSRNDFKQRLLEKHPYISDNEANLAHYIQLDLNTKETSLATGISIGSVRVYKSKLKSKLGLKVDDDLAAYLKTI